MKRGQATVVTTVQLTYVILFVQESGFSSVVSAGKLVAVSNLTWHTRLVSWSLPIAHATEVTLISQHPRLSHLQQALGDLAQKIKSLVSSQLRLFKLISFLGFW